MKRFRVVLAVALAGAALLWPAAGRALEVPEGSSKFKGKVTVTKREPTEPSAATVRRAS